MKSLHGIFKGHMSVWGSSAELFNLLRSMVILGHLLEAQDILIEALCIHSASSPPAIFSTSLAAGLKWNCADSAFLAFAFRIFPNEGSTAWGNLCKNYPLRLCEPIIRLQAWVCGKGGECTWCPHPACLLLPLRSLTPLNIFMGSRQRKVWCRGSSLPSHYLK